jgi:hypothetical protein
VSRKILLLPIRALHLNAMNPCMTRSMCANQGTP